VSVKIGTKDLLAATASGGRISHIYHGSNLIYRCYFVKITFYFDRTNINPKDKLLPRAKQVGAEWRSTSDPHVWEVITPLYTKGAGGNDDSLGIARLFCGENDTGLLFQSVLGTCQVLSIDGDYDKIETLDRLFQKCSAITSVSKTGFYDKFATSTDLINVNSVCNNCTNITDGSSLGGYNVLSQIPSIMTHAATFTNADDAANLAQIPFGWGGTQVPASTLTTSTRKAYSGNNYTSWTITADGPDWTDIIGVYLLTTSSISSYEGVSMNRTRIRGYNELRAGTSNALYFYTAFVQCSNIPGTGSTSATTWVATTDNPNGQLVAGQGNTDMSGTLDYNTYGPISLEYGTYDSTKDVYFAFLVLNVPIAQWNGLTDAYGYLYNTNFLPDAGLQWFTY